MDKLFSSVVVISGYGSNRGVEDGSTLKYEKYTGVGFFATENHIISSTHVVSAALGVTPEALPSVSEEPVHATTLTGGKDGEKFSTHIIHTAFQENVVILECETPLTTILRAPPLVVSDEVEGHSFRIYGIYYGSLTSDPYAQSVSGKIRGERLRSSGWIQIDADVEGAFSENMFSGTPVWDEQLAGVVGMLAALDGTGDGAYFVPLEKITHTWSSLKNYLFFPEKKPADNPPNQRLSEDTEITLRKLQLPHQRSMQQGAQTSIAQKAFGGNVGSQATTVDITPQGDVVVVSSDGPGIVEKIPQQAAYERIAKAADTNRTQIEQIYEQGRAQAAQWSRFSLIAAGLGFLVVIGGVVTILIGNTPAGIVTSIAGIIPEVAAALFFNQAREANKRVDDIRGKLLEAEGIHRAIELSLTTDEQTQNRLKEAIITKILGLPPKE